MGIDVVMQKHSRRTDLPKLPEPLIDLTANRNLRFIMQQPKTVGHSPLILVVSSDEDITAVFEMVLDDLLEAVAVMVPQAEKWGWKSSEITETPEELYSRIVEAIKNELGV